VGWVIDLIKLAFYGAKLSFLMAVKLCGEMRK
jgi:hypothetical protein